MRWTLLCCCLVAPAAPDVVLDAMFLAPADAFAVGPLRAVLEAHFGPATVDSVLPDTITGAEARAAYNRTDIFRFQLLHVTRVRASIATLDDANTTAQLRRLLPALCARIAPVVIVAAPEPPSVLALLQTWLVSVPFALALGGWVLTICLCGGCWLLFLCWPTGAVIPAAVPAAGPPGPYAAPKFAQGLAAVRLELSCAAPAPKRP